MATTGELLNIEPQELQFPFDLRKQISCSLRLINKGDNYVGFKVKTTNPKKYCVRPNTGVVLPRSTCDVTVTMQAQKEAPLDMQCKDKFLVQCIVASPGAAAKDLNSDMVMGIVYLLMLRGVGGGRLGGSVSSLCGCYECCFQFTKESGNQVEECRLRVLYVAPPRPPSPVREDSEEGSPRPSVSDNGNFSASELAAVSQGSGHKFEQPKFDAEYDSSEARTLIYKLTEEKNSAIQQNNNLRQELELLKRNGKSGGGIPLLYVLLVGLIGIMLGYLMKRS